MYIIRDGQLYLLFSVIKSSEENVINIDNLLS